MSAGLVARRYAKALFKVVGGDLAKAKNLAAPLDVLGELFENKEANAILCSPAMPIDLKSKLLDYGIKAGGDNAQLKAFCDAVAEAQSMPAKGALGTAARAAGFHIEKTMVEAEGVCPSCADKANA